MSTIQKIVLWIGSTIALVTVAATALFILFMVRAHADGFYCPTKEFCVSTTRYGNGDLYKTVFRGTPAWVRIDCENRTINVQAEGEAPTGPSPIDFAPPGMTSFGEALYNISCPHNRS